MSTDFNGYASSKKSNFQIEFLSRKEVAELFGVSLSTIWSWSRHGILHPVKIGNKVLFEKSTLLKAPKPIYQKRKEVSND